MIQALRIMSIVLAIGAVVLLIKPAVFGGRTDPQIEEFLKAPGVVDKLTAAKGSLGAAKDRDESQGTPLVRQAAAFADHLKPKPPPTPVQSPNSVPSQAESVAPMGPVSTKFNLIATSFFASNPAKSLALIDEPGKGLSWVKQGGSVGRLTIDKITDGSITVKDGQRTSEMTVRTQESWRGLLKNPPPETRPGQSSSMGMPGENPESPAVSDVAVSVVPARIAQGVQARPGTKPDAAPSRRPRSAMRNQPPQPIPADMPAASIPLPDQAGKLDAGVKSAPPTQVAPVEIQTKPAEPAVEPQPQSPPAQQGTNAPQGQPPSDAQSRIDQIMTEMSSSKITEDEAGRMEKLAEELKKMKESEPKPEPSSQPDVNSAEPNTPPDAN